MKKLIEMPRSFCCKHSNSHRLGWNSEPTPHSLGAHLRVVEPHHSLSRPCLAVGALVTDSQRGLLTLALI